MADTTKFTSLATEYFYIVLTLINTLFFPSRMHIWYVGTGTSLCPVWTSGIVPSISLRIFFFWPHLHLDICTWLKTEMWSCVDLWNPLHVHWRPPLCPEDQLSWYPWTRHSLFNSGGLAVSIGFFLTVQWPGSFLQIVKWGNSKAKFSFYFLLGKSQEFKTHVSLDFP